ncbi:hypothetical protein NGB36_02160 [Streptomyces sp. RB6PN25]|uniref:Uncharacterized protein n=1 Tax=Streptomyces humicola TaxID=2953240 RepID=A0ABT1PP31_9ACTN|nr:hypothetical protein [Streptomyces humicola]MCQ4079434.1 hypothetical protein [Streptomyces humicola]
MEREPRDEVERALRTGFDAVLAPEWERVCAAFRADVDWRRRVAAERGLGAMLAGLLPGARWEGTVLVLPFSRPAARAVPGGRRGDAASERLLDR